MSIAKQQPHKHAELIKAWADGAEIEFLYAGCDWTDAPTPCWLEEVEYRIKPIPNTPYGLDMDKMIMCIHGKDKYMLLPMIKKGCYNIVGYNWFDLEKNNYNSCGTWKTKEGAIETYSRNRSTAVFKNVDLMDCL